jgi:hypothetical protein
VSAPSLQLVAYSAQPVHAGIRFREVRAYDKRRNGIFSYRSTQCRPLRGRERVRLERGAGPSVCVPERENFGAYVKRRGFRLPASPDSVGTCPNAATYEANTEKKRLLFLKRTWGMNSR